MSEKRPFRFGLITSSAPTGEAWKELARQAEALGYTSFLLADHFVNEFPPLVALMAAADATSRLRVGSMVFDNDFRHPALLAKEVATLDLLSGGRFELGIGAGWHRAEYAQVGLPFDEPGTRISRLEEALAILKQFFTQETVNLAGKYYTVTNLQPSPRSVQRPHPPIFIGGGGKRLLTLAAREADIVGLHLKANKDGTTEPFEHTEAALTQKVAWLQQAAGERFSTLELNLLIRDMVVTDNPRQAAEQYTRDHAQAKLTTEQLLNSPYLFIGAIDQMVERLLELRERFGISYFIVGDDHLETFAPVVAKLSGK